MAQHNACEAAMPLRRPLLAGAALLLVGSTSLPAAAEEVLVATAANFASAIEALRPIFAAETGHTLVATTGSTGKLYAQIVAGAPFEVLLSADAATPARLEAERLTVDGSRFTYAVGRLVLWSADPELIAGDGAAVLAEGAFRHLAIANPDLAPYGVAARQTLEALGLWDDLQEKLVVGQNIGQAHALAATGAAELGLVALSAVTSPDQPPHGSLWQVPQALFAPIRQDAVQLLPGADNPAAAAFLTFLRSPEAAMIIEAYGYAPAADDAS
jgi:molybdate transport system substrate-binding protein